MRDTNKPLSKLNLGTVRHIIRSHPYVKPIAAETDPLREAIQQALVNVGKLQKVCERFKGGLASAVDTLRCQTEALLAVSAPADGAFRERADTKEGEASREEAGASVSKTGTAPFMVHRPSAKKRK